jgi:TolB protein
VRAAFAILVAAACASVASASSSAPAGHISFLSSSGIGGSTQVWVANADGTRLHPVTPPEADVTSAALSHDGLRVAFVRRDDIYVMNVNGTHLRRLTFSAAVDGAPAWSWDGRWIAWSSSRSGHAWIEKMRASDGGGKTVLAGPGALDVPAWSPSGRQIAYAGVKGQIWVMNSNGSGKHALTRARIRIRSGVDWAPAWSPDGRRVAYESNLDTGSLNPTNEIWLINADGSHAVRLTHNAVNDDHPSWSPDGAWIAYASPKPHPGRDHVWLVRPSGSGLHRLTGWPGEQFWPTWAR